MEDIVLVSYVENTTDSDKTIVLVGRKRPNESVDIINAFQGEEAENIYRSLVTKKESKK